ncbi:MAG: hypothetical protein KMY55_10785 [Dethiosulfatibacter sp.]|nr:hypothetical protein [Dethiosulfatibacter sp.]
MKRVNDFSEWMNRKYKTTYLVISLIIFTLFMIAVLPNVSETTKEITGTNISPDTSFFYTSQKLYDIAESYGEAGRAYYIRSRFSFDIVWPIVYLFFLVTMMTFLFNSSLHLIPFLGVFFDFLENLGASYVMFRYPLDTGFIATITPIFTLLKWIFIYISFGLILAGLVRLIYCKLLMEFKKK